MTREEAIKYGIEWLEDEYLDAGDRAFIELALEALKRMPQLEGVTQTVVSAGKQEPSGDAVDRKLVCAFIAGLISDDGEREKGLEYIRNMPPVNPQPCEEAISRAEAVRVASGYCHPANVAKELAKLPPVTPQPKTEQFAKWVATEIFDDMWEYNKDTFDELACRKLAKLGIVRAKGDEWELVEPQESEG